MKGDEKISDIMPKEFKEMSEVAVTKHLPDHLLSYVQPVSQNMHLFEMRFLDDVDAQEVAQRTERPTHPTSAGDGRCIWASLRVSSQSSSPGLVSTATQYSTVWTSYHL